MERRCHDKGDNLPGCRNDFETAALTWLRRFRFTPGSEDTETATAESGFNCETGITDDTTHREGVDRMAPRDHQNTLPIGHYGELALTLGPNRLSKRTHCVEGIDP